MKSNSVRNALVNIPYMTKSMNFTIIIKFLISNSNSKSPKTAENIHQTVIFFCQTTWITYNFPSFC
eukprot:UN00218